MNESRQANQLDTLTGLRFVAALLVFGSHVVEYFPQYGVNGAIMGLSGVSFFFVLSGFILTYVYARRDQIRKRDFYLRRFARIWPLHLATLLIVLFFVLGTEKQFDKPGGWLQFFTNLFLVQSWVPETSWVFSINGPAWSLSVEAFFYLAFPFLLLGGRKGLAKTFVGICLVSAIVLVLLNYLSPEYISGPSATIIGRANPFLRLFDFVIGMACGFAFLDFQKNRANNESGTIAARPGLQLLSIAICIGYYWGLASLGLVWDNEPWGTWLNVEGTAPLFALVIFVFAAYDSFLSRILKSRLAVYLGEISYAFYLIHQPILRTVDRLSLAEDPGSFYWVSGGALLLSLAASMVLHHLVELPVRKLLLGLTKRKEGSSAVRASFKSSASLLARAAAMMLLLCVAGGLLVRQGTFRHFNPAAIAQVVDGSVAEFRDVRFDDDAVLRGLTIEPQG